jgi:hypothetical protein
LLPLLELRLRLDDRPPLLRLLELLLLARAEPLRLDPLEPLRPLELPELRPLREPWDRLRLLDLVPAAFRDRLRDLLRPRS